LKNIHSIKVFYLIVTVSLSLKKSQKAAQFFCWELFLTFKNKLLLTLILRIFIIFKKLKNILSKKIVQLFVTNCLFFEKITKSCTIFLLWIFFNFLKIINILKISVNNNLFLKVRKNSKQKSFLSFCNSQFIFKKFAKSWTTFFLRIISNF